MMQVQAKNGCALKWWRKVWDCSIISFELTHDADDLSIWIWSDGGLYDARDLCPVCRPFCGGDRLCEINKISPFNTTQLHKSHL